jgi:hypothetical protein
MRRAAAAVAALTGAALLAGAGESTASPDAYGCVIGEAAPFFGLDPGQLQVGGDYCVFTALGPVQYDGTGTFTIRVLHRLRDRRIRVTYYRGRGPLTQGVTRAVRGDVVIADASQAGAGLFVGGHS